VLPTLLLSLSIVLVGSGVANSFGQWIALRLLLGIFEAGVFPGCIYTLTTWYAPTQIHSRVSIYYLGGVIAGGFSGLLAFGIGHLDGTWGFRGWRFIYVIEGVFTAVVAIAAFFLVHDKPAKVKRWLTDEERRYIVLRNQYEYGGNTGGTDDSFSWPAARQSLRSWHVWVLGYFFFSVAVAVYGLSFSIPTIVSNMGFTAANAQLLSCPPYVLACAFVYFSGWYSDRYRQRTVVVVGMSTVGFIGLLITVLSVKHKSLIPLSYIGVCLATGGLYCLSPAIAVWVGLNQAGQTKRALSVGLATFIHQLGGILGSNIYLVSEKPGYPTGFGVSLAILGSGLIVGPCIYWWAIGRINRKRDAITEEEIYAKYTPEELQEMGDRSPLYRYER
jgi:MFS family permease